MESRVKAVFKNYASFIPSSPQTTADVEMLCKYLSYFVPDKLIDKATFSEGSFTLLHLLVLLEVLLELISMQVFGHKLGLFINFIIRTKQCIERLIPVVKNALERIEKLKKTQNEIVISKL